MVRLFFFKNIVFQLVVLSCCGGSISEVRDNLPVALPELKGLKCVL